MELLKSIYNVNASSSYIRQTKFSIKKKQFNVYKLRLASQNIMIKMKTKMRVERVYVVSWTIWRSQEQDKVGPDK